LITILAVPLLLSSADSASAQMGQGHAGMEQQDTTQMGQMHRQMMSGSRMQHGMMRGHMMQGRRMGRMGGHAGVGMLLGLKTELELTDEQVAGLEKIHQDHQALTEATHERVTAAQEAMKEAHEAEDWEAIEAGIDELTSLHAAMAKSQLGVQRDALGVLTDAQREKLDTWREGARLMLRQGMEMRRHQRMQGQGMRGRGMRMHRHAAPPDTASQG
jgi:hypothetical protein